MRLARRAQAGRRALALAPLLGLLLLAGCSAGPAVSPLVPPFDAGPYRGFIVPRPLLPFSLDGAAQFSLRGDLQSGDLSLQAVAGSASPAYRLELHVPLTGSLALEIRITERRVLVIDYANESYLDTDNSPGMRLRLFEMDLSPEELLTLLTGRIGQDAFAAAHGSYQPQAHMAELRSEDAVQRFRLDDHGLPSEWVKEAQGRRVFRVEFREYLELAQAQGPPLRLPRKMRVYADDGPPRLVLGVRSFRPGAGAAPPDGLERLPEAAARFSPGVLPDAPLRR